MKKLLFLFGGYKIWKSTDFRAVDDRVRGGVSQSYLSPVGFGTIAHFQGTLDPSILGAGFASQESWLGPKPGQVGINLSNYDGLLITLVQGLDHTYSINLSNEIGELLDPGTGKRQSTVNYHYYFTPKHYTGMNVEEFDAANYAKIYRVPWDSFKPYYRGRPVEDKEKRLDTGDIKSLSIMIASGFGEQKGNFSLYLQSIAAYKL